MSDNLQKFGPIELEEFVHSSINSMLGITPSSELLQSDLTKEDLELTRKALNSVLCSVAMIENENDLQKSLKDKLPNLEKSQMETIYDIFQIRRIDIMKYMVHNLNSLNSPLLNNFNWRLKWVLGSSTLASYKEPLLQCDFVFKKLNDESFKQITTELSSNEVDLILSCLESAKTELEQTDN